MTKTTGIRFRLTALSLTRVVALTGLLAAATSASAQPTPQGSGSREVIPTPAAGTGPVSSSSSSSTGSVGSSVDFGPAPDSYELWDAMPPIPETTGTALDRGFWYSEVEAVVMVRQWNRQRLILMGDGLVIPGPLGSIAGFTNGNRALSLGRSTPGREGSLRFTLGRFLFRDSGNRDHNLELTVLGGGEFGQNSEIFSNNPGDPLDMVDEALTAATSLNVLTTVDLGAGTTFSEAESSFVQYDSRLNSFELNYSAETRLNRDRMELLPTGQWVRRANSGLTYRFLGGVRYIDLTENLEWIANNIGDPVVDAGGMATQQNLRGEYLIRTSNDAFGPQVGFGVNYTGPRFSIETLSKLGVLSNDLKTRAGLSFTESTGLSDPSTMNFSNSNRTDTLSVLAEMSLVGRYHLRPNISLRAGYHLLLLSHVALAPHQIDFAPDDSSVNSTGDVFYHGISTGMDFYW